MPDQLFSAELGLFGYFSTGLCGFRGNMIAGGIIWAIVVTMLGSALPTGHNLGVINAPQKVIRKWVRYSIKEEYDVTITQSQDYFIWGSIVSVFLFGALFGSSCGSFLADRYGRKRSLFYCHALSLMSGALISCCRASNSVELLFFGRFLAGLAGGCGTSLVPLYLSEISPPDWRGVMGTLFPLGLCSGILISQVLGMPSILETEYYWPFLAGGHFFYTMCSLVLHNLIPPSPTYLILYKNDPVTCNKVLCELRGGDPASVHAEEAHLITTAKEREAKTNQNYGLAFSMKQESILPFIVVIVLNIGQQLTGINAVFFYSTLVLSNSGLGETVSQSASLCAGVPNLIMAGCALPLIRYVKRRYLLLTSIPLYGFGLLILTTSLYFVDRFLWMSWVALAAVFVSVLTYGIGLGPLPYMIGTELFTSDMRGAGLAAGGASNWGANLVVGLLFPLLQESLGIWSFGIFIILCFFLTLFSYLWVPETLELKRLPNSEDEMKNEES